MDNEFILFDRLEVIRKTIEEYGEENFYISFSGGKDSTVVHYLVDMAKPENKIPRVFINTGIEYNEIVKFVKSMAEQDDRVVMLKPSQPIKPTLEKYGYPFKSKEYSEKLSQFQRSGVSPYIKRFLEKKEFGCPDMLRYQFTNEFNIPISRECCRKMKKEPGKKWAKQNGKSITITGMRAEEGGTRANIKGCIITDKNGKLKKFHPLVKVSEEWEEWFIQKENIKLCPLYYSPYNFKRTGCKGCPFRLELQDQLEIMERYFPAERKQCERIWGPVYEEYRRLGYRLKKDEQLKLL